MPRHSSSVDGAELFYHYYTPEGRPAPLVGEPTNAAKSITLVLLHQWPLTSRMYDSIILGLCETHGYNVIAPDRRGFGKSEWSGPQSKAAIGYKELGQDISGLLEKTKPGPFVFVASSMSTGEALLAYLNSPYVQENCQGMLWISTSLPYPTASPQNPKALPQSVWDETLQDIRQDRPNFIANGFKGPFGVGSSGSVSDKQIAFFEKAFFKADPVAVERCLKVWTREDLFGEVKMFGRIFNKPFLLIHGGEDGGVAAEVSAELVQKSIPGAKLITYEGGGHDDIIRFAASIEE
ncbi:hypothetical protein ACHAPA_009828 [Fusarium lateritium]